MGSDLGARFHAIRNELIWLYWRWGEFRVLFVEQPSRIALMDKSAPHFFSIVYDAFFETTLLGIARLVGPPKSGRDQFNLSIHLLPPLLAKPSLKQEVTNLVEKAKYAGDFAITWRHKRIAHRDLTYELKPTAAALPDATPAKVDAVLSAIRDVVNRVELAYCDSHTWYGDTSPWGAKAVLTIIRDGLLRRGDRETFWKKGERHPDDIDPPEKI